MKTLLFNVQQNSTQAVLCQALILLQLLGFVFIPVFIASKVNGQQTVKGEKISNPGENPSRVHGEAVWRSKDLDVLGRPLHDPLHIHQDLRQPLLWRHLHPAGDPLEHLLLYRWLPKLFDMTGRHFFKDKMECLKINGHYAYDGLDGQLCFCLCLCLCICLCI